MFKCDIKYWRVMSLVMFAGFFYTLFASDNQALVYAYVICGFVCAVGADILAAIKKMETTVIVNNNTTAESDET